MRWSVGDGATPAPLHVAEPSLQGPSCLARIRVRVMAKPFEPIAVETTQPLDMMLHQILNQALVSIGAKAGSVMLVAEKQRILQIKARLGPPRSGRVSERVLSVDDSSIASWVVRHKRSYLCRDVENDDNFMPSRSGRNFTSLLSVPIVHEGKVIAVINAYSEERQFFPPEIAIYWKASHVR